MKVKMVGCADSLFLSPDKEYKVNSYEPETSLTRCDGAWITVDNGDEYYIIFKGKDSICNHLTEGSYWEVIS